MLRQLRCNERILCRILRYDFARPLIFHVAEAIRFSIKREVRALRDRVQEQLSDAYTRSVRISSTELNISPSVQGMHIPSKVLYVRGADVVCKLVVRRTRTLIALSDIFSSLSSASLSSHLASLRRDLIAHYIEYPLQQPMAAEESSSSSAEGVPAHTLSLFPLPTQPSMQPKTLEYLRTFLNFIASHLLSALPDPIRTSFPHSLCKPLTNGILRFVLVPSIPSSLADLAPFLDLVHDAVAFEDAYVVKLLGDTTPSDEREIAQWAARVGVHYGRKRRIDLLANARALVLAEGAPGASDARTFRAELAQEPEVGNANGHVPGVVAVQGDVAATDGGADGWGFDDEPAKPVISGERQSGAEEEGDAWDFEDDEFSTPVEDAGVAAEAPLETTSNEVEKQGGSEAEADDPADAWGWTEDAVEENGDSSLASSDTHGSPGTNGAKPPEEPGPDEADDGSAWDDPWADPDASTTEPEPAPPPPPPPAQQPKQAKRLEKLTAKGKAGSLPSTSVPSSPAFPASQSRSGQSAFTSPTAGNFSSVSSSSSQQTREAQPRKASASKPPELALKQKAPKPPETYTVSGAAKDITVLVEDILSEGDDVAHSTVFKPFSSSDSMNAPSSSPSTLILQTAASVLDLYRALYPIALATPLSERPGLAMRFSNDCLYIVGELRSSRRISKMSEAAAKAQLIDSIEATKALGDWWFAETIVRIIFWLGKGAPCISLPAFLVDF